MRRAARRRVRGREDADKGDADTAEFTGGESGTGEETGMREGEAGVRCGWGNSWPNMDGLRAGFRRADFFASTDNCVGGGTWT